MQKPFAETIQALKRALRRQQQAAQKARLERLTRPRPAPPPEAAPEPPPEEDDEQRFQRAMQGVRPLDPADRMTGKTGAALPPPRDPDAEAMAELADLVQGRTYFDIAHSDEHMEGIARGLDRRLLKKLRKGTYAVQAHLDLHGKTRLEARELLPRFIAESRQQRRRCVLVVHGRGLNSKDNIPVLKESLKVWLCRGSISRAVLAFCSARPSDGGAGAVYVLLRR